MQHFVSTERVHADRRDWANLRAMLPYLLEFRGRALLALGCLVLAKVATVGVPLVLKALVDAFSAPPGQTLVLPVALLFAYGALKLSGALFNELRDVVFARVRYRAMRRLATRVLAHLHALSLRYHLERRSGALSRDLERGTRSISSIVNYMVFSVLPVLVEFGLVAALLIGRYPPSFAVVTFGTVAAYVAFTLAITEWRMDWRHDMNRLDSLGNAQAFDGLMNYETVKYFGNERLEIERYDRTLAAWEQVAAKSQTSMSLLNFGQAAIIVCGVTGLMVLAARGVLVGSLTVGDLVMVNALLLQLFIPLGVLGIVYRQIKYALADMDLIFKLLERRPEVADRPGARPLPSGRGGIRFERVDFHYQPDRPILQGVDFAVEPGRTLAVVGPSGAGKSTLARLLFRFYDVTGGQIRIDGLDLRDLTQDSLRAAIGIVPQDTVLFNESLYYNLWYGRPTATREEVLRAAEMAHLRDFIEGLPEGWDTLVGERGLKLSGGERQRVAIARAILKRPRVLIFDEATSALDSRTEQLIQQTLAEVAEHHTTLVIAHRLSTVVDADRILVLDQGRLREQGSHRELLTAGGLYAAMWDLQQRDTGVTDQARNLSSRVIPLRFPEHCETLNHGYTARDGGIQGPEPYAMKNFLELIRGCLREVREIMPWDLAERRIGNPGLLILDVREPYEFQAMHIPESMNVPRGILESACEWDYEETVPELVRARQREVVVVCRSGYRSVLAANSLLVLGFSRVASLRTGLRGWKDDDGPLVDAGGSPVAPEEADAYFTPRLRPEQLRPRIGPEPR